MTSTKTADLGGLGWLVEDFVQRTAGVSHAVVISTDGILLCQSRGLPPEPADQLAAVTAGLLSLAQGAARLFEAGAVMQTIVEMERGYLFLASVGEGSCLAVLAAHNCEAGMVGHQMTILVAQLGDHLVPEVRTVDAKAHAGGSPAAIPP